MMSCTLNIHQLFYMCVMSQLKVHFKQRKDESEYSVTSLSLSLKAYSGLPQT